MPRTPAPMPTSSWSSTAIRFDDDDDDDDDDDSSKTASCTYLSSPVLVMGLNWPHVLK